MNSTALFRPERTITVAVVSAILFLAMLYSLFIDTRKAPPREQDNGLTSTASTGNKAFLELLRASGYVIAKKSPERITEEDLETSLVIYFLTAGDTASKLRESISSLASDRGPLLILPKWMALPNRKSVDTLNRTVVDILLNAALNTGDASTIISNNKGTWSSNFNIAPSISLPQLVAMQGLQSQITLDNLSLYGSYQLPTGSVVHLLADPDIISNYAIRKAGNAIIALSIVKSLLPEGSKRVIFAIPGANGTQEENPLNNLFKFPANILLVFFLLLVALLVWMGRWKRVHYWQDNLPVNSKQLLLSAFGSYFNLGKISNKTIAEKYLHIKTRQTARKLFAPAGMREQEQMQWLGKFTSAKGAGASFTQIQQEIQASAANLSDAELLRIAGKLHYLTEKLTGR